MKKHKYILLSFFILLNSIQIGISFGQKSQHQINYTSSDSDNKKIKNKKSNNNLSEKAYFEFISYYHEANKQKMLGNYNEALELYMRSLKINRSSAAAMYEIAGIYLKRNDILNALLFARAAVKQNPENKWYVFLLAAIYKQYGFLQRAAETYEMALKIAPNEILVYYELASIYSYSRNFKSAIQTYDKLEKLIGINEAVVLEKRQLYIAEGNSSKALEEINKLINNNPNEPKYYGILAETYISQKKYDEAFATFNKLIEIDSANGLVHLSLADLYRITGNREKAKEELRIGLTNPNVEVEKKYQMILNFYPYKSKNNKIDSTVYEMLDLLCTTTPNEPKTYALYADYLLKEEKTEEARNYLRKVVAIDKNKYLIWEQLLLIESDLSDFTAMFDESTQALEYFPEQPSLYFFKGIAAYELKKYDDAIDAFKGGLDLVVDNNKLKAQFYTYLGETYNKKKLYKQSYEAFENLLKIEPNNYIVLNNYSYYLSIRGDSLNKAEKMSKQCIDANPKNSTYLDTYAWVLYKLNKLEDALTIIEQAISAGGDKNAVIVEHYGDILYKNNQIHKANEMWNKAKELGGNSEFLEDKILNKKLIE